MTNFSLSVTKIGLTQKEVLHLFILQLLNQAPSHAAEIYRLVSESSKNDILSPTRSRTYVYKTLEELLEKNLIEFQKQGRKKILYLSKEGVSYFNEFTKTLYPTLEKLMTIIEHMQNVISNGKNHTLKTSLTDSEKQYISKIINVKALIQWYTLQRLIHEGTLHGGALYREMHRWFGWMNNHGYFYQILREMNHDGLIHGTWLDEETRSQRKYAVTTLGENQFSSLQNNMTNHLFEVHQFLRSMIGKFNHTP